jgi:streptomycin 6-kinase
VLKLGIPNGEISRELEALLLFSGTGTVDVLEYKLDSGAILLKRLSPGEPLSTVTNDKQATSIASELMQQLRREVPVNHNFSTVIELLKGFEKLRKRFQGSTGPFPSDLLSRAESLASDLASSAKKEMVLHGDLHQDNILSDAKHCWVAVDPKGVVGEAEYEIGAFLRNRIPSDSRYRELIKRRLHQFSEELELDPQKVRDWSLVHSVLSAWWSFEDEGRVGRQAIRCARVLSEI